MAAWVETLKIGDIWAAAESGEMTAMDFARQLADRLQSLNPALAARFRDEISEEDTFDDVDELLDQLYDWGDYRHRCWIDRHAAPEEGLR